VVKTPLLVLTLGRVMSFKGHHHTEATKARISKTRIGQQPTAATKAKMSKVKSGENHPFYGKKHSAEAKAKISAAKRRR